MNKSVKPTLAAFLDEMRLLVRPREAPSVRMQRRKKMLALLRQYVAEAAEAAAASADGRHLTQNAPSSARGSTGGRTLAGRK